MRGHAQEKEGARVGGGWPRRGRTRVRRKEVVLRTTTWAGTVRTGNGGLVRKALAGGLGSSRDGTGSWCQGGEGAPGSGGHTEGGCWRDRCRWSRRAGGKTGPGGLRAAGQGVCGIEGEAGQWAEEGGPCRAPKGGKRAREGGGCQPEAWRRTASREGRVQTGARAGEGRPPPGLRGLRSPAGEPRGEVGLWKDPERLLPPAQHEECDAGGSRGRPDHVGKARWEARSEFADRRDRVLRIRGRQSPGPWCPRRRRSSWPPPGARGPRAEPATPSFPHVACLLAETLIVSTCPLIGTAPASSGLTIPSLCSFVFP